MKYKVNNHLALDKQWDNRILMKKQIIRLKNTFSSFKDFSVLKEKDPSLRCLSGAVLRRMGEK